MSVPFLTLEVFDKGNVEKKSTGTLYFRHQDVAGFFAIKGWRQFDGYGMLSIKHVENSYLVYAPDFFEVMGMNNDL
jgi:hypothetical protein